MPLSLLKAYIYQAHIKLLMDASAAEKIREAELQASNALENDIQELKKNLALEEKKALDDFERFNEALTKDIAKIKRKRLEAANQKIAAIRRKCEKDLKEIDVLSKKNTGKAVVAFVKTAGSWRAT